MVQDAGGAEEGALRNNLSYDLIRHSSQPPLQNS